MAISAEPEQEKAKSLDIARLLAFRDLMSGNNAKLENKSEKLLQPDGFSGFLFAARSNRLLTGYFSPDFRSGASRNMTVAAGFDY